MALGLFGVIFFWETIWCFLCGACYLCVRRSDYKDDVLGESGVFLKEMSFLSDIVLCLPVEKLSENRVWVVEC